MGSPPLAERLRSIEGSPTLALAAKAKALAQAGQPVIDWTAGEPDFPTPDAVKQAAVQAIQQNRTKYTAVPGIPELRAAVAAHLSKRLGVPYEAKQTIVSCGAKHVLYNALQAVCQAGDDVLIIAPYWVSYVPLVQLAGATPVLVHTKESENYQLNASTLSAAITPKTKAIILNSPSNPTGAVLTRETLAAILPILKQHRLWIISDEIYDQLVYPPHRVWSPVQVDPSAAEQTIVVNGVSKTYSMTGWRIGYAAGPAEVIDAMGVLQSHATSNPASISQYAALAALTSPLPEIPVMVKAFERRRDVMVSGLNKLPGLSCYQPQGAFYAWCNVAKLGAPAAVIADRLLNEAMIVGIPGEGFGSPQHVRFSFATSMDTIERGLERLGQWLSKQHMVT